MLLEHPAIREIAVLGLPDETYGEVGWECAVVGVGEGREGRLGMLGIWACMRVFFLSTQLWRTVLRLAALCGASVNTQNWDGGPACTGPFSASAAGGRGGG